MATIVAQAVNSEPPQIMAMLVGQTAGAASCTQTSSLAATGGTGPAPRPRQQNTVVARGQVALAGGFALPVPLATMQATALLSLSGGASATEHNWLIAGVVQAPGRALPTQQQTCTVAGLVTFPRPSGANPRALATLRATAAVRHPLVGLAAPLWLGLMTGQSSLVAGGLLVPFRGRYQSAHGLHGGRYTFTSARSLASGSYRFASAHALHGGAYRFASARGLAAGRGAFASARGLVVGRYQYQSTIVSVGGEGMGATPILGTPQSVSLRTHDKNVPFSLSFAPDVSTGDSISSAVVTVTARPASSRLSAASDVTSTLLRSQQISGTTVIATLGNANAVLGTRYLIRVVATMASGVVLQETIGDGDASTIVCDE